MPNADNINDFENHVGTAVFRDALAEARSRARDDRERRQVERLAAAVHYWLLAADWFRLRAEAVGLRKQNPREARKRYEEALGVVWPKLRAWMSDSMPPGWLGVRAMRQWHGDVKKMEEDCAAL